MQVEVGKYAGFCDGVKYAVENAFSHASKTDDTIFVDGHLIHNPQTLKMLEESNVATYEEGEDFSVLNGKKVIIRAHGVSPKRHKLLSEHAGEIINLTCKYVARAQGVVKKYSSLGYRIIIVGNKNHPEIIGVSGFAENKNEEKECFIVLSEEDILNLPDTSKKTLIIAQTTLEKKTFDFIILAVKNKYPNEEIVVVNTICNATEVRQKEMVDIAKRNDVVLVIGGSESSNTKNLYKIASSIKPAHYVEYKKDLDNIDLSNYKKVGIMAGASTPDWLIEEIATTIKEKYASQTELKIKKILDFVVSSYLLFGIGAFLLSFAVSDILSESFAYQIGIIVSCYYVAMSLMNAYTNDSLQISDKKRYIIYQEYKTFFTILMALSFFTMIIFAFREGHSVLILTMFSTVLGIAYNMSFKKVSGFKNSFWIKVLKKLIPFKAFVISFSVTILLNGSILLHHGADKINKKTLAYIFSAALVFIFMFMRQAMFEIKSSQSDKIAGATTLTAFIDIKKLATVTSLMPLILLTVMLIGIIPGWYPLNIEKTKYFIPVVYSSLIPILLMRKKMLTSRYRFSILIDSPLYVLGIIAFI